MVKNYRLRQRPRKDLAFFNVNHVKKPPPTSVKNEGPLNNQNPWFWHIFKGSPPHLQNTPPPKKNTHFGCGFWGVPKITRFWCFSYRTNIWPGGHFDPIHRYNCNGVMDIIENADPDV